MALTVTRLANGDLELSADTETREEIRDSMERNGFWSAIMEAFEPYFTNGSYHPFDASDGNPFVGLTSAPCIAEWLSIADDSTRTLEGDFWFFGNYAITCPMDELCDTGRTVFTLAR